MAKGVQTRRDAVLRVRLPQALLDRLHEAAERSEDGESASEIARRAILKEVSRRERKEA